MSRQYALSVNRNSRLKTRFQQLNFGTTLTHATQSYGVTQRVFRHIGFKAHRGEWLDVVEFQFNRKAFDHWQHSDGADVGQYFCQLSGQGLL